MKVLLLGTSGIRVQNLLEAAKGNQPFFAIYANSEGERLRVNSLDLVNRKRKSKGLSSGQE